MDAYDVDKEPDSNGTTESGPDVCTQPNSSAYTPPYTNVDTPSDCSVSMSANPGS